MLVFVASSLNVNAIGAVGERGVLQIYPTAHPEYSIACDNDPRCAFQAAYKISSQGTNFTPWTVYDDGLYRQFL
jgi:hypothetical protein